MELIQFAKLPIFISGVLFHAHLFNHFRCQNFDDESFLAKIGTHYIRIAIVFTAFISIHRISWKTSLVLLPLPAVILHFAISIRQKYHKKCFETYLPSLFGLIVLYMKAGKSFRSAFGIVIASAPASLKKSLNRLHAHVVFSQQKQQVSSDYLRPWVIEMRKIDQAPHQALRRLQNLREQTMLVKNFRQKSGQMTLQLRAQGFMLSILFLALTIYMSRQYNLMAFPRLWVPAFILFGLGSIILFRGERNFKWKI